MKARPEKPGRISRLKFTALTIAVLSVILLSGCGAPGGNSAKEDGLSIPKDLVIPAEHSEGEGLFNAKCSGCHGARGAGTSEGPPFIDRIYEPNHHGDQSFYAAVQGGVTAHHWNFGNMAPVPELAPGQVTQIIGYVRFLQKEAGVF